MDEFVERNQCGKGDSRNRTLSRESRANELEDHIERHAYICIAPSPGDLVGGALREKGSSVVSAQGRTCAFPFARPDATYES